jgi:cytidyltransferase-like protein
MARLVITLGTFDLPHQGHVFLLQQCRKIAGEDGRVAVAVNPDGFVQEFKGITPAMKTEERMKILREFRSVDFVVPNTGWENGGWTIDWIRSEAEAYALENEIQYTNTFLVIGTDWAPPKDYYGQLGIDQGWLDSRNITMLYVPRIEGYSSTEVRERIRNVSA